LFFLSLLAIMTDFIACFFFDFFSVSVANAAKKSGVVAINRERQAPSLFNKLIHQHSNDCPRFPFVRLGFGSVLELPASSFLICSNFISTRIRTDEKAR